MKTDLDHLPGKKRRELDKVVETIHAEFLETKPLATSKWKREGRILKIVLFGSYARGDWVDERYVAGGYQSDYDLLIVVNYDRVVDFHECWHRVEDRLIRDPGIKTPVNLIVHTMAEVNEKLKLGHYFFTDIVNDGVLLYELKGQKPFAKAKPLNPQQALEVARGYYDQWMPSVQNYNVLSEAALERGMRNERAFLLHQTVERAYTCLLLVLTYYSPNTHNIKFLRSLAHDLDERLAEAWPHETRFQRRCFELLKRAYVESRYSKHYSINEEELAWIAEHAESLQEIVEAVCRERLAALSEAVRKEQD